MRQFITENQRQIGDIQSAGGDIGSHQHAYAAVLETHHGFVAVALFEIAMQGADIETGLGQMLLDLLAIDFGVAEHQSLRRLQLAEQVQQGIRFTVDRNFEKQLFDMFRAGIGIEQDFFRVALIALRQRTHGVREGRREQQGLIVRRQGLPDGLDGGLEAHVEHAVGLIQNQRIHCFELQCAGFNQLENPARRADHDGRFMHEGFHMHANRNAAVERGDLHVRQTHGDFADGLRDLIGQFSGRTQH